MQISLRAKRIAGVGGGLRVQGGPEGGVRRGALPAGQRAGVPPRGTDGQFIDLVSLFSNIT